MYLKLHTWSRHKQTELKEKTLGKQKKLVVWLRGSQYHRNWQKNLAEQDFCATADDLNGVQVWIWKQKASLKERNHIWQLERYLMKFSSCQDSKVEATPEFHQTSLILAGVLDLFLPVCCYSFSRKRTRWWIFLRLLWGGDETCVGSQCGSVGVWEYCGIHGSCWLYRIHNHMKIDVLALRFALKCRWQDLPSAAQVAFLLVLPEWCVGSRLQTHTIIIFPFFSDQILSCCRQFLFLFFFESLRETCDQQSEWLYVILALGGAFTAQLCILASFYSSKGILIKKIFWTYQQWQMSEIIKLPF